MNLLTQETGIKFTTVTDWQLQTLNMLLGRNSKFRFNKKNLVALHPSTDMKAEFQIKYQYLGLKPQPEEKKEAKKEIIKDLKPAQVEEKKEVKIEDVKIEDVSAEHLETPKPVVEVDVNQKTEQSKMEKALGGAVDAILNAKSQELEQHVDAIVDDIKDQREDFMRAEYELAVPVDLDSTEDQSPDQVKQQIAKNIEKMGFNPEDCTILVTQVENQTNLPFLMKVYRVKISSKVMLRVFKFKVSVATVDRISKALQKAQELYSSDYFSAGAKELIAFTLQVIVTKVQDYIKNSGYVVSNVAKLEGNNYVFTAVQSVKASRDILGDKKKDPATQVFEINNFGDKVAARVSGGHGRRGHGRGYGYQNFNRLYGANMCRYYGNWGDCIALPPFLRMMNRVYWFGGDDEKVPIDIDAKVQIEYSSNMSSFNVSCTNLPVALDLIFEADSDYAKLLESKGMRLMVVKFMNNQDAFSGKNFVPVSFDTDPLVFDDQKKVSIKRVKTDANHDEDNVVYVFYLFAPTEDLKDFDRYPEEVRDKLSIKLRMSIVTSQEAVPI